MCRFKTTGERAQREGDRGIFLIKLKRVTTRWLRCRRARLKNSRPISTDAVFNGVRVGDAKGNTKNNGASVKAAHSKHAKVDYKQSGRVSRLQILVHNSARRHPRSVTSRNSGRHGKPATVTNNRSLIILLAAVHRRVERD